MSAEPDALSTQQAAFVEQARRATLGTIAPDGRPRLVPVCFVLLDGRVYIPLDDKPKSVADPRRLARVRDIAQRPAVTLLVDRWDEDWTNLAWLRLDGTADLLERAAPGHPEAVTALRVKYDQYRAHAIDDRPLIRISVERVVAWGSLER